MIVVHRAYEVLTEVDIINMSQYEQTRCLFHCLELKSAVDRVCK